MGLVEAGWYEKRQRHMCQCQLCPHRCVIAPGRTGRCHTRYNEDGTLRLLAYGQCAALALDPIEKKPLRQFHPGRSIFSVGSWGCNLACSFCQNWRIAQGQPPTQYLEPDELVRLALDYEDRGNLGVAFTYNEPLLSYEYILATAPLLRAHGLATVLVSNGYVEEEPLRQLLPHVDAWNIDLKGFTDTFYRTYCGATLAPVQRTIQLAAAVSHVEVTTLIIPGLNDQPEAMEREAAWLGSLSRDIPLHLSRYFPCYQMTRPPTPKETLYQLAAIARQYVATVYIGNI